MRSMRKSTNGPAKLCAPFLLGCESKPITPRFPLLYSLRSVLAALPEPSGAASRSNKSKVAKLGKPDRNSVEASHREKLLALRASAGVVHCSPLGTKRATTGSEDNGG